jgi:tripartite-type tricarboxylate transporter receptor subunit TctC
MELKNTRRRFGAYSLKLAAVSTVFATGLTSNAWAQGVSYAGKTIEWVVPFPTGGGTDVWARFLAPFLTKYLPGNPTVVIRNVPGGGSITGANQFAASAKPDGLSLLGTSGSTQFPYLLGDSRVRYDYKTWEVIMAGPTGGAVYISSKYGLKSAKELSKLQGQKLVFASQGATSLDLVPMLAFKMLGLDVQFVFGMKGGGEKRLAFERGEATLDFQTTSAYFKSVVPMVESGKAVPLFSWGVLDSNGNLARDPAFPDLPHFAEAYQMATGKAPSGRDWDATKAFLIAGIPANKTLVVPKGTPPDVVATLRKAFRDMRNDPDYKAGVNKVLGGYEQAIDADAERVFQLGTNIDPSAREMVRSHLSTNHNVKF